MAIEPADFCTVAEQLHFDKQVPDQEPRVRTVAGRAYYAAYLAVREAAREATNDAKFNIGHKSLASHLDEYEGTDLEAVAIELGELRYFRDIADYWPFESISKSSVGMALNSARRIVKDYQKLSRQLDAEKLKRLNEPQELPRLKGRR